MAFSNKFFDRVVKTALYVSTRTTWEELVLSKKTVWLLLVIFGEWANFLRLFVKHLSAGLSNWILSVQRNNLKINTCFDKINIFKTFSDIKQKKSVLAKVSRQGSQNRFLQDPGNNPGKKCFHRKKDLFSSVSDFRRKFFDFCR